MGFQLELIFKFNYLTLLYNIILSFKVVIRCWSSQVYDVHLKSLSSWETEPLQRQVKTLLTRLLSTRNHSKLEKLKAAKQITFDDVSTFARRFFVDHSTECFFFGDLNVERAEELSTIVLNERTKFLEKLAESENIKVELFCWKCFLWRVFSESFLLIQLKVLLWTVGPFWQPFLTFSTCRFVIPFAYLRL